MSCLLLTSVHRDLTDLAWSVCLQPPASCLTRWCVQLNKPSAKETAEKERREQVQRVAENRRIQEHKRKGAQELERLRLLKLQ